MRRPRNIPYDCVFADRSNKFSERAVDEQQDDQPEVMIQKMRPNDFVDDMRDSLSKTAVLDDERDEMFREAYKKCS